MNWKTYQRQHVQAVDMCAATIFAHRLKYLPLKSIYLLPRMYEQFRWWTEKQLHRELQPEERLEFDGVNIEKGSTGQSTPLLLEMWDFLESN